MIGINFDNRGWIFKPDNGETFLRAESPNQYDKEGGVAGNIDIQTGTADQLPNEFYKEDFPKVSGYPFQSYLLFCGLKFTPSTVTGGGVKASAPAHYILLHTSVKALNIIRGFVFHFSNTNS